MHPLTPASRRPGGRAAWCGCARRLVVLAAALGCTLAAGVIAAAPPQEVWIELSVMPPKPSASGPAARRQHDRVAQQQQGVARQLRALGIEPTGHLRIGRNAIAARVSPTQAAAIERLSGVVRVRPAEPLRPRETQADEATLQGSPR